ncbi:UNVERIFIED_CONTAM: hypothetical protein RMT77_001588 [Armadillidium vulgare]
MEEIAIRSGISKLGSKNEVGRLMFMVSFVEACWPLVDEAQFGFLYSFTLPFFPSAVHGLMVSWAIVGVLGFLFLFLYSME